MTIGSTEHETPNCLGQVPINDLIENARRNCQKSQEWNLEMEFSTCQVSDSPISRGFYTPEEKQSVRRKQKDIDKMQLEIQKQDKKIERADASIEFFTKYPHANYSFQAVVEQYSDQALQKLIKKIEEDNLLVTDPTTTYILLYNFFRGKEDLENNIKIFFNKCIDRIAAGEDM